MVQFSMTETVETNFFLTFIKIELMVAEKRSVGQKLLHRYLLNHVKMAIVKWFYFFISLKYAQKRIK